VNVGWTSPPDAASPFESLGGGAVWGRGLPPGRFSARGVRPTTLFSSELVIDDRATDDDGDDPERFTVLVVEPL
jgi:hypothetical protein